MSLKDFFFPKFCLGCNHIGCYFCLKCQKKLKYFEYDSCFYCGKKSLYGLSHPGCQRDKQIDGFLTIFHYNNLLKKTIKAIKYRRALEVWDELTSIIDINKVTRLIEWKKNVLNNRFDKACIQPVPLHISRYRQRGFNQAEMIAQYFNRFLKLKIADLIMRKKETKPQAQIKEKNKRKKNIRNAFVVKKTNKNNLTLKNKTIILVDDIVTTGETVQEAAKELKKQGVDKVYVLTLAKG